jgi:hypothetical protein
MANVGRLNILVGASVGGLASGLKGAAGTVEGFASTVTSNFGKLAAGLGLGLGLAGLKSWVSGAMDTIRTTGIMAKKLSVSTEAFTELNYAALKSGVSTESFAGAMGKMEKTIGNAAIKGGPAAKVFSDIGLNVQELASMSPDQAFLKISDAIKGIEDPFRQAAAITSIFGKGGLDLSIMLNKGSDEIISLGKHAKELGVTFTDMDVTKIKEATASWKEMKAIIAGAGQQFAIALAPSLKTVNDLLLSGLVSGKQFFGSLINEVGFFVGTWSLQWELIKANALITWDTIKAGAVGAFDATIAGLVVLGANFMTAFENFPKIAVASWEAIKAGAVALWENLGGVFQDIGATVQAFASGTVAALKAAFNLENPLTAFRDSFNQTFSETSSGAFATIRDSASQAWSDSIAGAGGLKSFESISGAAGEAGAQGFAGALDSSLDRERQKILGQIADTRKEFDAMQAGTPGAAVKAAGGTVGQASTVNAVSSQLAGATQHGTTEAASQIFASMSARMGKDDEVAANTAQTAANTERVATAIENLEMPDLEMIEAF